MISIGNNIYFDAASDYAWDSLNENMFLISFFESLMLLMGSSYFKYTYFVLSSHNPRVIPKSADILIDNKILFFISDESSSIPFDLQSKYFAIFKCYMPNEIPNSNIFPFNLGYVNNVILYPNTDINKRNINVFFSGNLNYNRILLYRELHYIFNKLPINFSKIILKTFIKLHLKRLLKQNFDTVIIDSYLRFTCGFKKGLTVSEYSKMLSNSKIVLCPKGFSSPETFRHMEAIRAGAVIISEALPDTYFYRNSPFIIISDWNEGLNIANKLIMNNKLLKQLQNQSILWWDNICNEESTAKYVRDQINNLEFAN